jgi:hypothetical protein
MVLIGAVLNACKISQCQYCGAIHELETDPKKKKQWSLVSKILMGHMVVPFLKKKMGHFKGKKEKKKRQ